MTSDVKNIKHLMIDANVNQVGIAKQFGWSSGYVSRLVRGAELGPASETNKELVIEWLEFKASKEVM
ncbi:XRE family transcriptional regulator [Weissella cibaria]|uniref:XRE family transcriptional regulator n=1 Tax=Weissella cibaria TaxID=137591 RepID=UPI000E52E74B|nr:XRE family transcriptional regulator [Weissella cibaria]MCS8562437.1 XRE family transcriptional regulator [Weissella cibaria]MCS8566402.1 XRE family transcriptional regulator [Weissella cibaria]MCS8576210.1 XRE family transcriptional regulator [Weissella cibaria]RHE74212.1 XRE family transcriptional regulator [Weissella cibaria]RHE76342.1 XRE family transcriptional regulator [Weissella cibaria]